MVQQPIGLRLDAQGYFSHDGNRFIPVGANYWPGSCGVEMWVRWPEVEIQRDLDIVVRLGLNCLRFFLRWQDFEPHPGRYDERMFERLAALLGWCRVRGIYAQPSLFVGWMSGGIFWPSWRQGRNVFADSFMVERAVAFARRAAEVIVPFHDTLLGIDQGNELCDLPDCAEARPLEVIAWCSWINAAIREVYPQALIVSGNEQNQLTQDTGWRLGEQPGTDYYSMHGYPVPAWHSLGFDGMTDPLAQALLPAYIGMARAFGPVLLQEFGTIVTFGAAQQDAYLRALLPAAWQAGANGFLWWCLRDITAPIPPYTTHNFESTLGLVNEAGQVKPGLEYYLEFARSLPTRPLPEWETAATGIYFPAHYYPRDNPQSTGQSPRELSRMLILARYLLAQCGRRARYLRGGQPIPDSVRTIVVPGVYLTYHEVVALREWVEAGGRLIWHGPDPINWGQECMRLLGARPVDYRPARTVTVSAFGEEWAFAALPRQCRLEVAPVNASTLARDADGLPMMLRHALGRGQVLYALPQVEETAARLAEDRRARDRWVRFYVAELDMLDSLA